MTSPTPRFLQWLRPSRRRHPPPRRSPLHLPEGVRAGEGRGDSQCLARALCRFRWVPYDAVPSAERRAYVRLQLLAWSPFEDSGYAVVGGRDGAMAFAWDQQAFEQRAQAAGLPARPARTLPETMLLPAHDDGLVLQACSTGVEGQFWRDRQLLASRWWPEAPGATAWMNFQRSAAVPAAAQVPEPPALDPGSGPAWLDEPWAPVITLSAMMERARLKVHAVAATLLALLLLPTLWLLHANWAVAQQLDALEAEKAQLTQQAQPVLAARSQSLAAMAHLDTLVATVSHPDALTLLSHVATLLPGDGSRIRKLEMDGRRLRLVLAVPAGTPRIAYVRALEGGGWLQDVREDTQDVTPGTVALSAEIRGNAPPAAVQAAGGAAPRLRPAASGAAR
ncbi:MAG: hypothetical protein MUF16_01095 [Burkholderiaceae bacterium]|nr:hypothetical protein [Burkholderiaceae bacterium]